MFIFSRLSDCLARLHSEMTYSLCRVWDAKLYSLVANDSTTRLTDQYVSVESLSSFRRLQVLKHSVFINRLLTLCSDQTTLCFPDHAVTQQSVSIGFAFSSRSQSSCTKCFAESRHSISDTDSCLQPTWSTCTPFSLHESAGHTVCSTVDYRRSDIRCCWPCEFASSCDLSRDSYYFQTEAQGISV